MLQRGKLSESIIKGCNFFFLLCKKNYKITIYMLEKNFQQFSIIYALLKVWTQILSFDLVLHLLKFPWKLNLISTIPKKLYLYYFHKLDILTLFWINSIERTELAIVVALKVSVQYSQTFLRYCWNVLLVTNIHTVPFDSVLKQHKLSMKKYHKQQTVLHIFKMLKDSLDKNNITVQWTVSSKI